MIKYIGSKRRLVPVLTGLVTAALEASPAPTERPRALDLFSGTARVAKALKEAGLEVTAVDLASYAHVLARTYVETDGSAVDRAELAEAIEALGRVPSRRGYVTEVFCERARYFHPRNGVRIDAMREEIERRFAGSPLHPLLLTSLMEAADRVDSTTGVQMAYLKSFAPRALRPIALRPPELVAGTGRAVRGDALVLAPTLGHFDVAYLDPPYNQHRYFANYHVWETLVRWDAPEHYGVACKRADCREGANASAFNRRREMPEALAKVIGAVDADLLVVSYNDESWVSPGELVAMCEAALASRHPEREGAVALLGFDQARYVGARIGIHNPAGERVGTVSHLRNTELVVVAGPAEMVAGAVAAVGERASPIGQPEAAGVVDPSARAVRRRTPVNT
ncbi:MAG TPA: DNA adenine methylase [Acidimicrobiales bacterium]|nr:DNA adenine methylase [Acidimicrobiales bacterium]